MDNTQRVLDWKSNHDPRSLQFGIADLVTAVEPKVRHWVPGATLDQGAEGACVGFGWTGDLLASPKPHKITPDVGNKFAQASYKEMQKNDEWQGENYSGTSVLAGAKNMQSRKYIESYRWAFGIEQVRDALIAEGPVVIGIRWYESMYYTRPSGLVEVSGRLVGGHCILLTGYHPAARIRGEDWNARYEVYRWRNSWGKEYGNNGSAYIKAEDLASLLAGDGEACVPINRSRIVTLT